MSSGKKPDDVRPEYDLASLKNGERGKYFKPYQQGSNVVVIDPDLAEAFPNAKAVNDALARGLIAASTRAIASAAVVRGGRFCEASWLIDARSGLCQRRNVNLIRPQSNGFLKSANRNPSAGVALPTFGAARACASRARGARQSPDDLRLDRHETAIVSQSSAQADDSQKGYVRVAPAQSTRTRRPI